MIIVDRKLAAVRTLDVVEADAIFEYENGKISPRATALLRQLHRDGLWLGCGCAVPMPVLNIALLESGRYVLRNNPTCGAHALSCPLIKGEADPNARSMVSEFALSRIHPEQFIPLHIGAGESGLVATAKRKTALALLLSLIEHAGLNVFEPGKRQPIAEQFAALRAAALEFTMAGGTPLGGWLETRIDAKRLFTLARRLRERKPAPGTIKWAAMLDVVESIKGRDITPLKSKPLQFYGRHERLYKPSTVSLALATVTEVDRRNYFELFHVAALPVLSEFHLFPVINDEERLPMKELFGLVEWIHKTSGKKLILRRNLFDPVGAHLVELRSQHGHWYLDLSEAQDNLLPVKNLESGKQNLLCLSDFSSIELFKKVVASKVLKPDE